MPRLGDRIWTVGGLLRAGVAGALVAVATVGAIAHVRNHETLARQATLRESAVTLSRIGEVQAVLGTEPVDAGTLRHKTAEAARLTGSDPVHRDYLDRLDPSAGVTELRAAAEGMRRHEETVLDRRLGEAGATARTSRWLIVWVSVVALLLMLAGGRLLERRFSAASREISAAVRRVRRGDWTTPAAVRSPRELADVATVLNESMATTATARNNADAATAAGAAFLGAMSQEIRTPMTAVTGMTALLRDTPLDDRQRELTETVHASGTALLAAVDDLLDLARIEAGGLTLDRRPFSLRGCMRRAMDPVAAAAETKGLHLSGHLASGCPERIRGDEKRVRRILSAILRQAVAHTDHGAVTVSASARPRDDGLEVRFSVRDTGLGVPVDRPGDPGMLLCRRLAGSMGGAVTAESRPGHGTTVTVTLRAEEAAQPGRLQRRVDGRKQALLVLVAEDDPVDQRLTRRMLERRGHRVLTVADGEAAVEAALRDRYDLLLMGSGLLVLDGPTAVRLIRADPPSHGAPRIIAVCSDADELEDFARAGVDGVLARPVDADDLDVVLATAAAYADVRLAGLGPLPGPDDSEPATIRACVDVIAGPDAEPAERRRLAHILHNYADRLPGLLDRMDEAAATGDTRNLARLAHALKASSATLGANQFAALCADLEDRAQHHPEDSPEVLRDLHDRAGEVSGTMEALSRQLSRSG
ncbi:histidine kinase dimerization/phospho-acceptor domain-containing protein [Actinoplanes utahensis]|uniref:histidine kinase dimerization/phospho-acceptor domain-containing protein n=1 Tax=Actinoplanes utahensis TaxID=1869 RepID=UPI001F027FA7|nr:histidine kinase dimerization/phospho-acceptor domain-containing protein [Actinoplanes utahensis]